MGIFDYVNVKIDCPYCGNPMERNWQSKDSICRLETIDPDCVDRFYQSCDGCEKWVEYSRLEVAPAKKRDEPFNLDEVIALGFTLVANDD